MFTAEIKLGMFVAELDRPWLETPFMLQGFVISDATEIALLQRYCRSVEIRIFCRQPSGSLNGHKTDGTESF